MFSVMIFLDQHFVLANVQPLNNIAGYLLLMGLISVLFYIDYFGAGESLKSG